jgi:hypothetical protein
MPTDPADPEAAALELVVRLPFEVPGRDLPPLDELQDFAGVLHAEGCLAGMAWGDAQGGRGGDPRRRRVSR